MADSTRSGPTSSAIGGIETGLDVGAMRSDAASALARSAAGGLTREDPGPRPLPCQVAGGLYPTESEILSAEPMLDSIDDCFLRQDPYAFRNTGFAPIVSAIRQALEVDSNGISVLVREPSGTRSIQQRSRPTA